VADHDGSSRDCTHPVGRAAQCLWLVWHGDGNVWELTASAYVPEYDGSESQRYEWRQKASRVFRGGSWGDLPEFVRAAFRLQFEPKFRNNGLGFRLAQD
jgi:formylglycine-generating enzyme required for sulfatase activity